MTQVYKEKLGVPAEHTLVKISVIRECRDIYDIDLFELEERNAAGEVVGHHKIRDITSTDVPNTREIIVE